MAEKIETLRKLLREGYHVEVVESDDEAVEATLLRGRQRVVLRFRGREARALLLDPRPLT